MEPDDLPCSRNVRPGKALVGRAQWKINQPPSLKREQASLEGSLMRAVGSTQAASSCFTRKKIACYSRKQVFERVVGEYVSRLTIHVLRGYDA